MTLQKAMRVRAELKKEVSNLNELIHDYPHQISFKGKVPEAEEIAEEPAGPAEKVSLRAPLNEITSLDIKVKFFYIVFCYFKKLYYHTIHLSLKNTKGLHKNH